MSAARRDESERGAVRVIGLATVMPPESWRADPIGLLTVMVPEPSALPFCIRMAPPLIVTAPVIVELFALIANTPLSFLFSVLERAERLNGVVSVRVLPWVTSNALFNALRLKVRAVEKLPVARKPVPVVPSTSRVMVFAEFPRAPSLLAERIPFNTSMVAPTPPKVLPLFVKARVPRPDFTRV